MPSYEAQMAARDRMLAKHPQLAFMGAHMASLEWSVDELGRFLDAHPNAVVDLAARMGQVQFQSNQDRERVRRFFIRYQDRLLYGTDLTQDADSKAGAMRKEAHEVWMRDWRYLTTDGVINVPELDVPVRGLALPKAVIRKIYAANAERRFGNPWPVASVAGKALLDRVRRETAQPGHRQHRRRCDGHRAVLRVGEPCAPLVVSCGTSLSKPTPRLSSTTQSVMACSISCGVITAT